MVDYLPSIYRSSGTESFTTRFLSIFHSMVLDLEEDIYSVSRQFDFERASGDMLRFIASWVCVDTAGLDDEGIRRAIAGAMEEYQFAQTPAGIRRMIERWTGHTPILVEHFTVRENIRRGKDKELYSRLYGDNPYKFFVLMEEKTFKSRAEADAFLERLRKAIPAHVDADLILLKQSVYLDWHTYLGVNSVISGYTPVAIDESISIHYDTMIGGENH